MKHRLQITLEDAANELLNQQENKSKYIEDLILKQDSSDLTTEIKRLSMLTDSLVNDMQSVLGYIETLKTTIKQSQVDSSIASSRPTAWSTIQEYPKELPIRSRNDITTEISQLEAERDEKLEYSQDYAENKRITLDYKTQIDALWAEFHAIGRSDA